MDFFNKHDFEFFADVRKGKYRAGDHADKELGRVLIEESVYAKTNYWAMLFEPYGFKIDMSWHWQNSGNFRSYTWAKIYEPHLGNDKVFFTVGVGSRYNKDNPTVNTLEYKLDCQRKNKNALGESMVHEFDNYMAKNCSAANRKIITIDDLENFNWDSLFKLSYDFIQNHLHHYRNLCSLTAENAENLSRKITRLCWNNFNWARPSGSEGKSISSANSFEKEKGYGYEEWLFDIDKQLNGFHYGFIQGFHKGPHKGNSYSVSLYSIFYDKDKKTSRYYWVGQIKELFILSSDEQDWAISQYQKKGWLQQMVADLEAVDIAGFNFKPISANEIINVKYEVEESNFTIYDQPILIDNPSIEIGNNSHYVVLNKVNVTGTEHLDNGIFEFKEGYNFTKIGVIPSKFTKREYLKSLKHKEIQKCIYDQLKLLHEGNQKKIGAENHTGYGTFIDLVVQCPVEGNTFYEIKVNGTALRCIREAIGQLLEYNFYCTKNNADQMIIVGPCEPDAMVSNYMIHLRKLSGFNLYYQYFDYESKALDGNLI